MTRLTFLISSLCVFLIFGCAPRHIRHNVPPSNRQKIIRKSHNRLQEGERKNRDITIRKFLNHIKSYLGTPYKFGDDSRFRMDCSGFVSTIFRESFDIELPHNAYQIYQRCQKVSNDELNLGDLVFFRTTNNHNINHVGIYLVDSYFAHASVSYGVIISELTENYYRLRYAGAGRIVDLRTESFDDRQ